MKKTISLLLTGGHAATTAIPVINEIKKTHPEWKLYWVGGTSMFEGKKVPTLAEEIMPNLGVEFIPIVTGRLQRKFSVWTIPSLLKITIGILNGIKIIWNLRPQIIVSFGGYASFPICLAGFIFQIPIIIHEQTVAVGRANKLVGVFASKILISRAESKKYFPQKTILTGNPVSPEILKIKPKTKLPKIPTIYITGGSSGSQKINEVVSECLYELLRKYKIIHQTGKLDISKFKTLRDEFPQDLKERYEIFDFVDPREVYKKFSRADIIISRAGANTVSEIAIAKRPAILIPIPWSAFNEQHKNAKLLEKTGLALVIDEKDLTPQNLLEKIEFISKNWNNMVQKSKDDIFALDRKAAQKIISEITSLLEK